MKKVLQLNTGIHIDQNELFYRLFHDICPYVNAAPLCYDSFLDTSWVLRVSPFGAALLPLTVQSDL